MSGDEREGPSVSVGEEPDGTEKPGGMFSFADITKRAEDAKRALSAQRSSDVTPVHTCDNCSGIDPDSCMFNDQRSNDATGEWAGRDPRDIERAKELGKTFGLNAVKQGVLIEHFDEVRRQGQREQRVDKALPKNEPQRRKLVSDAILCADLSFASAKGDWAAVGPVIDALDERAYYVAEERVETADRIWKWLDQNGHADAAKASFEVRELFFYPETEDTDGKLAERASRTDYPTAEREAENQRLADAFDRGIAVGRRDAIAEAVRECEGEKAACERHARAMPRQKHHQVGASIAAVCAHRIRGLGGRRTDSATATAGKVESKP